MKRRKYRRRKDVIRGTKRPHVFVPVLPIRIVSRIFPPAPFRPALAGPGPYFFLRIMNSFLYFKYAQLRHYINEKKQECSRRSPVLFASTFLYSVFSVKKICQGQKVQFFCAKLNAPPEPPPPPPPLLFFVLPFTSSSCHIERKKAQCLVFACYRSALSEKQTEGRPRTSNSARG